MEKPESKKKLGWISTMMVHALEGDPDKAKLIIETAFPGYTIRKIRKDAGHPKEKNAISQ